NRPIIQYYITSFLRSDVDDDHTLGLEVVVERFGTMLAADTARLDAAEGQLVVAVVQRIDPDVAGLEFVDRFVGVQQVARPDRRAEAEFRRVRFLQGFVEGFE